MQIGDINFVQVEGDVDQKIIEERNTELQRLANDVEVLRETVLMLQELAGEQGELLEVAEEHVLESAENVEEAVEIQEKVATKVKKNRLVVWLSGGGAAGGAALGALGFLVNPPVGIISMVALSALGFGTGRVVGKQVS